MAMNMPMPTPMAFFMAIGMALMIMVRRPVAARMTITTPISTTRPRACGQVMCGAAW